VIQSNVALKNRHKSKTDNLILDRKKWDFQIRIILIQIKCFEQLAPDVWAKHKLDCGKANIDPIVIEGPIHAPHNRYPIRPEARQAVEEIVTDLEAEGIIRQTSATTNSPVWPVKKSDNSCGD